MFFKMLKKDIMEKKGLNIVVFIFITIAAALVFSGLAQLFSGVYAESYNQKVYRTSDIEIIVHTAKTNYDEQMALVDKSIDEGIEFFNSLEAKGDAPPVDDYYYKTNLMISADSLDFENLDEDTVSDYWHLTTIPEYSNLIYDLDSKPFYVENGKIAITKSFADRIGAQIGDKVKFTTQDGYIFEFEISTFTKDALTESCYWDRFIISDSDFEILLEHSYYLNTNVSLYTDSNDEYLASCLVSYLLTNKVSLNGVSSIGIYYSENRVFNYIITVFIMLVSFFLILVVFMTIRFTMVAAIKEQEKEIGTMKAIGSDTFAFRWLFCAKYIFFAVVGSVIGAAIGIPLHDVVTNMFLSDNIALPLYIKIIIAIISALLIIGAIVLFSLFVMRRINKISPVDAIHGENRGERFGRGFALFLHKRKLMPESFCLALTDILGRAKRYIFLVLVYFLGATIMLATFNLKNSVLSEDYLKYFLHYNADFMIKYSDELQQEVSSRTGIVDLNLAMNEDLKNHGIPAEIDYFETSSIDLHFEDREECYGLSLMINCENCDKLDYQEGGTAPVLDNEIAVSSLTAERLGLKVGQRLMCAVEISENGIDTHWEEREYIVTGFFNYMENGGGRVIMGGQRDDILTDGTYAAAYNIYADEKDKADIIKQMKEIYGEENILDLEEAISWTFENYESLFNLLVTVMSGVVIFITILVTYLCITIFISEEISDIALMKSIGISTRTIRLQYIFRFVILLAVSIPLALLFLNTGLEAIAGVLFNYVELRGFKFINEFPVTYIVIPAVISATALITAAIKVRGADNVQTREITEE